MVLVVLPGLPGLAVVLVLLAVLAGPVLATRFELLLVLVLLVLLLACPNLRIGTDGSRRRCCQRGGRQGSGPGPWSRADDAVVVSTSLERGTRPGVAGRAPRRRGRRGGGHERRPPLPSGPPASGSAISRSKWSSRASETSRARGERQACTGTWASSGCWMGVRSGIGGSRTRLP